MHRQRSEAFADGFFADFEHRVDNGLMDRLAGQLDAVEAMLVCTKIIELTSKKSSQHKLQELVQFMHDDLSTVMLRELIICADILCRSGKSNLTKKLNTLENHKGPLADLKNCAWDLYLLRVMDQLTNANLGPAVDFYIGNIITFDEDIADIIKLTELKAIAVHRASSMTFPFLNEDLNEWLGTRVGEKRMSELAGLFQNDAFDMRAERRSTAKVKETLEADRIQLFELLKRCP